ncbi:MAG TPA: carbohydrate-binding family 9-like protein, partial [bacterium]|nr:carbohydrate-binding family 9-like protein [bacterium]
RGLQKGVVVQGSINQPGDADTGWTIELALPWAVLKEQAPEGRAPRPGAYWRVNFSRVEWRTRVENGAYVKLTDPATGKSLPEDNWVWAPTGLINIHYPELWGFVQFSSHPAGEKGGEFNVPEAEQIRWFLRQVYYRQRQLHRDTGQYAKNWSGLKLQLDRPAGCTWPPSLSAGPETWEALLTAADGKSAWHIRHDGLIWPTASQEERDRR